MSNSGGIPTDLSVIANLLTPEELDTDTSKGSRIPAHAPGVSSDGIQFVDSSPFALIEDDSEIPGLDQPHPPSVDHPQLETKELFGSTQTPENQSNELISSEPSGTVQVSVDDSRTLLDSVLAKYQLEAVDSDSEETESSSSQDEESSEEGSTEEEESESSETESSSTTSSSSTSSSASIPLPGTEDIQGNDHNSDTESNHDRPMRLQKEKAKLHQLTKEVDGASDSDSDTPNLVGHAGPTTVHEVITPQVKMPSITEIPQEEPISLLGEVASIIEDVVVIKSAETGIQRVLDTDSLLVFEDRKVLGLVFETFGPLKAPFYTVRFPSSSQLPIRLKNFESPGSDRIEVFYCTGRSQFTYTSKLMLHKGNDASNLYDEEVGEDEIEFSDDDAEREWHRQRGRAGKAGDKRKRRSESVSSIKSGSLRQDYETDESVIALSYDDSEYQPDEGSSYAPSNSYAGSMSTSATNTPSSSRNIDPRRTSTGPGRGERRRGRGRGRGNTMSHHPDRGRSTNIHGTFRQPNPSVVHTQHTYANNEYNPVLAGNTSMPSTLAMGMGMSNPMQMLPAVYQGQPYWPGIPSPVTRSGHYGFAAPTQVPTNSQLQNGPTANIPMQTMGYGLGTPGPGVYINPRFAMMNMTQGNNVPLQEPGSNSQSPQEPPNTAHNS